MKRVVFIVLAVLFATLLFYYFYPRLVKRNLPIPAARTKPTEEQLYNLRLKDKIKKFKIDRRRVKYSDHYAFFIDMSIPSGRKRFFVYNLKRDSVISAGLVAHGSCNQYYLDEPKYSNITGSGCSSLGKYKVGYQYNGRFGKAYKLFGIDSTNSNAFKRAVVLHAYECVPGEEVHPQPICNSLGCPMISYKFLDELSTLIRSSRKPILLWIYE